MIFQTLMKYSPSQIEAANRELEKPMGDRALAEEVLQKVNDEIELRVKERTKALKQGHEQMLVQLLKRHEAQEQLEESNRQIVHILESITDAFYALDSQWQFTYVNKEAERVLHRKREELLGKNIWDEFPEAVGSLFEEEYRQAIASGVPVTFESFYPPLDTWVEVRAYPGKDGLTVFFRDVTQQKQHRETLARSEELYRSLARNFPNGAVLLFDFDFRNTLAEGTALQAFGLSKELIEGKTLQEIFPPDICDRVESYYRAALVGEATGFELPYRNRTYIGHSIPLRNECGEVFAGSIVMQDITERKQVEEALRLSEQKFQKLAANVPGMIYQFRLGTDGLMDFLYVSSGCREIYELEPEEIQQNAAILFERVHPDDSESLSESIAISASSLQPWRWEGRIVIPSGQVKWIEAASRPELQENGDIVWDGVLSDISDRKLSEEALRRSEAKLREQADELKRALGELQQTQSQLIQAEKMSSLGQLVAGIAHEINNPVSFIYGNIEPAKQYVKDILGLLNLYQQYYPTPPSEIQAYIKTIDLDFLSEDLEKLLGSMKVGAERIRKIVESLRNFSRLDEADRKQVDIHEGIDNTLFILQSRLNERDGYPSIQVIKEYGNLPLVECYAGQINQVFMNILNNAIDAIEEGEKSCVIGIDNELESANYQFPTTNSELPTIRIRTEVLEGDRLSIRIADNGPGIQAQVQQRLFDPFFTTKPIGKGTGLGLSISYQIVVEKHKGELKCSSTLGQGAEFLIAIPL